MGFLDKLFGRREEPRERHSAPASRYGGPTAAGYDGQRLSGEDEQALARYRYMLKTAPPETIELAHQEAFAKLTPQQRQQVLQELAAVTPPNERGALADDPRSLARVATRAEMRQPGTMERTFGGYGGGPGFGTMMAGTIFGSLVAGFVGSMIAQQFFDSVGGVDFADPGLGESVEPGGSDGGAHGDFVDAGAGDMDFGGDFGGDI